MNLHARSKKLEGAPHAPLLMAERGAAPKAARSAAPPQREALPPARPPVRRFAPAYCKARINKNMAWRSRKRISRIPENRTGSTASRRSRSKFPGYKKIWIGRSTISRIGLNMDRTIHYFQDRTEYGSYDPLFPG